jgi:hypothetical protein
MDIIKGIQKRFVANFDLGGTYYNGIKVHNKIHDIIPNTHSKDYDNHILLNLLLVYYISRHF